MRNIIGLDAIANQFGSPEVAGESLGGNLQADQLPRGFVGMPTQSLPALTTREIQVDVQREMRPDRFVVGPQGAFAGANHLNLQLLDIKVGTVSLNASRNPVPMELFGPLTTGISIRATMTAVPAIGIQVIVRNIDAVAAFAFGGVFFGPTANAGSAQGGQVGAIVGAAEDASVPETDLATDARVLPQSFVGIPYTPFAAPGEQQYIQIDIQRDLRPDRMVLPFSAAENFLVRDVRVGTVSLNASLNPAVGNAWGPTVFGTRLRGQVTATPSVGISLSIERAPWALAEGSIIFAGAIFGPSRFAST